ncbi:jg12593 [Pararge aegeria aegeria]|uniref:Jg12593 protein n=1 Tax=Pararge aegeria aegeria TaxID=348720 RepID=A0A8S4S7P6_9NEOP|nr:jg12593 [Pararge aegeria aegeria]
MAWSMPNSGQWNPGIGMTADMMGSYTQEQWALMQQQNWQQWSQWQHQYAQWQNQIGGEYAKHLQGLQALAGFQPVAAVAVPPPVPPPDKPPPPPPHENDQPLYGSAVVKAVSSASTVKPLKSTQPDCNNGNTTTGNNQNRSYIADPHSEKQSTQGVNSEALRMLAEEEKSFDIQFQKWEEEIEKWKKENVNHPDKQAYREYEQKFEACRAQLLERRQLMKIKRDNLMGNVQPASTTTKTGNNKINAIPTPSNTTVTNYTPIKQTNVQSNVQNKNINVQSSYSNNKPSQYEQHNNAPHQAYKRNDNNRSVDPKDRNYDAYQNLDAEYKSAPQYPSPINPPKVLEARAVEEKKPSASSLQSLTVEQAGVHPSPWLTSPILAWETNLSLGMTGQLTPRLRSPAAEDSPPNHARLIPGRDFHLGGSATPWVDPLRPPMDIKEKRDTDLPGFYRLWQNLA